MARFSVKRLRFGFCKKGISVKRFSLGVKGDSELEGGDPELGE